MGLEGARPADPGASRRGEGHAVSVRPCDAWWVPMQGICEWSWPGSGPVAIPAGGLRETIQLTGRDEPAPADLDRADRAVADAEVRRLSSDGGSRANSVTLSSSTGAGALGRAGLLVADLVAEGVDQLGQGEGEAIAHLEPSGGAVDRGSRRPAGRHVGARRRSARRPVPSGRAARDGPARGAGRRRLRGAGRR